MFEERIDCRGFVVRVQVVQVEIRIHFVEVDFAEVDVHVVERGEL